MGNVDAFLKSLLAFDKDAIPLICIEKCEKDYISNPAFNAANIRTKSGAAAVYVIGLSIFANTFVFFQVRLMHVCMLMPVIMIDT